MDQQTGLTEQEYEQLMGRLSRITEPDEWEQEGRRFMEATRLADAALAATPEGQAKRKADHSFATWLVQNSRRQAEQAGQEPRKPRPFRWFVLRAVDPEVDLSPWTTDKWGTERVSDKIKLPEQQGEWPKSHNALIQTLSRLPNGTEVIIRIVDVEVGSNHAERNSVAKPAGGQPVDGPSHTTTPDQR